MRGGDCCLPEQGWVSPQLLNYMWVGRGICSGAEHGYANVAIRAAITQTLEGSPADADCDILGEQGALSPHHIVYCWHDNVVHQAGCSLGGGTTTHRNRAWTHSQRWYWLKRTNLKSETYRFFLGSCSGFCLRGWQPSQKWQSVPRMSSSRRSAKGPGNGRRIPRMAWAYRNLGDHRNGMGLHQWRMSKQKHVSEPGKCSPQLMPWATCRKKKILKVEAFDFGMCLNKGKCSALSSPASTLLCKLRNPAVIWHVLSFVTSESGGLPARG